MSEPTPPATTEPEGRPVMSTPYDGDDPTLFLTTLDNGDTLRVVVGPEGVILAGTDSAQWRNGRPALRAAAFTTREWTTLRAALIVDRDNDDPASHDVYRRTLTHGDHVRVIREGDHGHVVINDTAVARQGETGGLWLTLDPSRWTALTAIVTGQRIAESGPRRCFWISGVTLHGQYVPSLVTEGEPGHAPLAGADDGIPWLWGDTREAAVRVAERANVETFGLTPDEVHDIVGGSMALGRAGDD